MSDRSGARRCCWVKSFEIPGSDPAECRTFLVQVVQAWSDRRSKSQDVVRVQAGRQAAGGNARGSSTRRNYVQ